MSLYVCTCICICTSIHTYMSTTHTLTHTHPHTHKHIHTCRYIHTCTYTYIHTHPHTQRIHKYMRTYNIRTCTHAHTHIHVHTPSDPRPPWTVTLIYPMTTKMNGPIPRGKVMMSSITIDIVYTSYIIKNINTLLQPTRDLRRTKYEYMWHSSAGHWLMVTVIVLSFSCTAYEQLAPKRKWAGSWETSKEPQ